MKDYKIFLKHILDETDFLIREKSNTNKTSFLVDDKTRRAVERSLEIIGGAVKNIPDDLRKKFPDVSWKEAAGLRDVLIHAYFDVDPEIVWSILEKDIEPLQKQIYKILSESQDV